MFYYIFIVFLTQIIGTIGIIYLGGFILSILNRWFYSNLGILGVPVCYITGIIGTPIHECSHALFCIIFGHKIEQIKLFQIDPASGVLGYVNHQYNSKNIYHIIGNFFIGVAPVIVMSAMLYGLSLLLMGDIIKPLFEDVFLIKCDFTVLAHNLVNIGNVIKSGVKTWGFWVFVIIGVIFSLHMTLSWADIKNSLSGLAVVLLIILISDIIMGYTDVMILLNANWFYMRVSICLTLILLISIIISFAMVVISFVIRKLFLLKNIPLLKRFI